MDLNNGDASPSKSGLIIPDYDLQMPAWSPECLKAAAIHLRLPRPRSLAWAILLNALPPPNADIVSSLKTHRSFYADLKAKLCMDPRTVIGDDPLSQNDESAWNQHFCDNELKALILQDVVRTFPEDLYFRDKDIQDMMVLVLFNWARAHSGVGYRQGMHEVLAPLLYELHLDRKYAPRELSNTLKYVLDGEYLEHDSYMAFSAVMRGLEKFYSTGDVVPSSCGRLPVSTVAHNPNEVVRYLENVREECLSPLDSELSAHLVQCNISMELFGIRWLRLLFGREFARPELPALWGFLFADGPLLPHIHYLVVALLIAMRPALMDADPGAVLSALMRPPRLSAQYACALALHLRRPLEYPRPTPPPVDTRRDEEWSLEQQGYAAGSDSGSEGVAEGADIARSLAALGLLRAQLPPAAAALARALPAPPPAAAAPLRRVLQVPFEINEKMEEIDAGFRPDVAERLDGVTIRRELPEKGLSADQIAEEVRDRLALGNYYIYTLAALLECRNHALIDVETALEAAEGATVERVGRRTLVPVIVNSRPKEAKPASKVKEFPLKLFHQAECYNSDLPCLDPLRLRTE